MELVSQYIIWKYSQPVMPVKTGIQKTAPGLSTLDSAPVFTGVTSRNDKTRLSSGCALYDLLIVPFEKLLFIDFGQE